jgi:hypothetical protein
MESFNPEHSNSGSKNTDPVTKGRSTIFNQPTSVPVPEKSFKQVPDVAPTNVGSIEVYPINIYTYKVLPTPEELTIDGHKVLRFYLFAETFIRPRIVNADNKITQVVLIARSLKQPATFEVTKAEEYSKNYESGYYNQTFFWENYWKPVGVSLVTVKHPHGVEDLPFKTITTSVDFTSMEQYDPFKVQFLVAEGAEIKPTVLRTTLPIFDMYIE